MLVSVETSQAVFLNLPASSFALDWNVTKQFVMFATNQFPADVEKAVFFAWVVELIYLVSVIGHQHAKETSKDGNGLMKLLIFIGQWGVPVFQIYADLRYGGSFASGVFGQIGFTFVVEFCVLAGTILCVKFLAAAHRNWK
jgi:hypothetical protein